MLFVSFWNIGLSNLPVGKFTNSAITGLEAAALISSAREKDELRCVTADDLLAPFGERAYAKHVALCAALRELSVVLSVDDFIRPSYSNPLSLARVSGGHRLIVVNCAYTLDVESEAEAVAGHRLRPEIALESISFNVMQQCADSTR